MSCFGCCDDDDTNKAPDGGGPYMVNNAVGNVITCAKCTGFPKII